MNKNQIIGVIIFCIYSFTPYVLLGIIGHRFINMIPNWSIIVWLLGIVIITPIIESFYFQDKNPFI